VEGVAGPPAEAAGVAGAEVAFAAGLGSALAGLSEYGRSGPCGFAMTTVEIACLKISCSWLFVSSTTEYLSKERIRPVSFTPLSRYNVIVALSLRAVFKKESWMFCAGLFSTADLLIFGNVAAIHGRVPLFFLLQCAARPNPVWGTPRVNDTIGFTTVLFNPNLFGRRIAVES
jgi:hypothetical protein